MDRKAVSAIMLTLMLMSMLTLTSNIHSARAELTDRKVGVSVGYWIQYGISVMWESNDPNATTPQYVLDSQQLVFISNVVESVSGTNVTFSRIMLFKNGTEKSETYWIDVDTGRGSGYLSFIAANLSAGDIIYTGLGKGMGEINETITRTYLGETVEINHHNSTTSGTSYFIYAEAYWNRATGVLYEMYMNHTDYTKRGEETYVTQETQWLYPIGIIGLAKTWTVNDDGPADFHTIQEAINAASSGDTIFVHSGTYYENVAVNKTVSLVGENKTTTIIDGSGEGVVLYIRWTHNVSVDSFTIRNGTLGLSLDESSYTHFRNVDLVGSESNFRISSIFTRALKNFVHDIDTSNTVNYKPICYWVNKQDEEVPIDAGYVALINCSRIVMRNLNLEHNYDGITLLNVRNSLVENVSISNTLHGLYLRWNCTNNIIQRNVMTNNSAAIVLQSVSSNNNVRGNIIVNNNDGIGVDHSLNNSLSGNFIANNENGICLFETRNNIISENDVVNNTRGIRIQDTYNNSIYHNNFINNEYQVYPLSGYIISANLWDDGYPSGGNYWSDFAGVDLYGGSHQNETGSDGIGDTPYFIDEDNQDNYPLMGMFYDFSLWYGMTAICNSTIYDFHAGYRITKEGLKSSIDFNVVGPSDTTGFCRIIIPRDFMEGPYTVLVHNEEVDATELPISNSTHAFLYFNYPNFAHIKITESPPTPPVVKTTIDVDPDALNLKSKGKWISAYIELPEDYDMRGIDRTTVTLNDTIHVAPFWVDKPLESVIGDYDNDGITDLMVKFDRQVLIEYIRTEGITETEVTLSITGKANGKSFEATDTIKVIGQ